MNSKGGIVGNVITSFPSMILIFVIMLLFTIISSYISNGHSQSYSLVDDFAGRYIKFDGEVISVGNAIEKMCKNESLESELKIVLTEYFVDKYGQGNAFALVYKQAGGPGGWHFYLYSWYGAFNDKVSEQRPSVERFNFEEVFGNYESRVFCSSTKNLLLYAKSGSEI